MRKRTQTSLSSNPFMVTSNQTYGMSLKEKRKEIDLCETKRKEKNQKNQPPSTKEYDLSFLYSRESDRIGDGIEYSDSILAKVLCEKESLSEAKKKFQSIHRNNAMTNEKRSTCSPKCKTNQEIQKALENFTHKPVKQNPLYMTSANEYGSKKPSLATYTAVHYARSQEFSNSYNKKMFRDQGLNTSLTRSNVHEHLDPQFV